MATALDPIVILPDLHAPYHDRKAWGLVIRAARDLKPKVVVTIGDFADFYAISHYTKDPTRSARLIDELDVVRACLDDLDRLKAKTKIFVAGNHEDRWRRYLQDKAPEVFEVTDVPALLDLPARGWTYVPYMDSIKLGKLRLTHDVGSTGRYAAHRTLDTVQHSVVTGHAHRLCYVVEGNAEGEHKLSAQFGWLGDASQVDYLHRIQVKKNWALGFGVGYLERATGLVHLAPIPIVPRGSRYTCVVNGRLYEA